MTEPSPPISDKPERYSRQTRFSPIGEEGQARIRRARVLICGCGALGSAAAESLARAGVGTIRLVDRDIVEWSNLQRQTGYTEADARRGRPKAVALAEHLAGINSEIQLDARALEFSYRNARDLAGDVDLILDGTDNVQTRFLINDLSYAERIPWIYAGVIEAHGAVQVYSGREGPCLRCTLPEPPPPGTLATCDTAGVIGPAVSVIAGQQSAAALRVLCEGPAGLVGKQSRWNTWDLEGRTVRVLADSECPTCKHGHLEFLSGERADLTTVLCGRRATQVRPSLDPDASFAGFEAIVERLGQLGEVQNNELFLRVETDEFRLTVFRDGRALFDGLTDTSRARSLYARFIGA